ncbi:MAG: hypothetical protein V1794_00800, partial [Candidatus Glassbacteria bacterium]
TKVQLITSLDDNAVYDIGVAVKSTLIENNISLSSKSFFLGEEKFLFYQDLCTNRLKVNLFLGKLFTF